MNSLLGQGGELYSYFLLPTVGEAWQLYYISSFRRLAWPGLLGGWAFLVKQERNLQRSDLF